jgi:hypothetical protein
MGCLGAYEQPNVRIAAYMMSVNTVSQGKCLLSGATTTNAQSGIKATTKEENKSDVIVCSVVTLGGDMIEINCRAGSCIRDLKAQVAKRTGEAVQLQYIFHHSCETRLLGNIAIQQLPLPLEMMLVVNTEIESTFDVDDSVTTLIDTAKSLLDCHVNNKAYSSTGEMRLWRSLGQPGQQQVCRAAAQIAAWSTTAKKREELLFAEVCTNVCIPPNAITPVRTPLNMLGSYSIAVHHDGTSELPANTMPRNALLVSPG